MPLVAANEDDHRFMHEAYLEAKAGFDEGGVPVGSVLVCEGEIIGRGRNKRVQEDDPIAHGEMDCLRQTGRRRSYRNTTIYTTLSPCMMCTGAILQFGIGRVVIGENENFIGGFALLLERHPQVVVLNHQESIDLLARFQRESQHIWSEDIHVD